MFDLERIFKVYQDSFVFFFVSVQYMKIFLMKNVVKPAALGFL